MPDVLVIGGGIAGLSAAWFAQRRGWSVLVLEADDRTGGKLRLGEIGGQQVDLGAEAFLVRRPEGRALLAELGAEHQMVHPRTIQATVLSRGTLHPLPPGTLMGVPTAVTGLAGLLSAEEIETVQAEPELAMTPIGEDVSVGDWVASRVGPAVVDRLVEPLLGGVYAGHASRLSLKATAPMLAERAASGKPLLSGTPAAPPHPASVFGGLGGGMGRWPGLLEDALRVGGGEIQTGVRVLSAERSQTESPGDWLVRAQRDGQDVTYAAPRVIVALPAPAAAQVLAGCCPPASAGFASIETADVAVVAALVPRSCLEGVVGSGILIPPVEGHTIKAVTYSAAKWEWTDALWPEQVLVRMSIGRAGDTSALQASDEDLARVALEDLGKILGRIITATQVVVQRWPQSLPQYAVGHLETVAQIREAVAQCPGLAVAGASLDGVGIPACISSAQAAVAALN